MAHHDTCFDPSCIIAVKLWEGVGSHRLINCKQKNSERSPPPDGLRAGLID